MKMPNSTPMVSSEIEVFSEKFPTSGDVLRVFHPDNWGQFIMQQARCVSAPKVSLAELADHYGTTTIKELVQQQFVGLYELSSQRELNQRSVSMAADLFCSQYGTQITPYGLMLYFALYPTKYKDSFREFDVQDILKQCAKFLRWWQSQEPEQQQPEQPSTHGISVEEMVRLWINEGRTHEDFRNNSGLYQAGIITDAMILQAQQEAAKGII